MGPYGNQPQTTKGVNQYVPITETARNRGANATPRPHVHRGEPRYPLTEYKLCSAQSAKRGVQIRKTIRRDVQSKQN